jgi:hypothetical protein
VCVKNEERGAESLIILFKWEHDLNFTLPDIATCFSKSGFGSEVKWQHS